MADNEKVDLYIHGHLLSAGLKDNDIKELYKLLKQATDPFYAVINDIETISTQYIIAQMMYDLIEDLVKPKIIADFKKTNEGFVNVIRKHYS